MKYRVSEFFATGFYSGYVRRAPGTMGTAVAALVGWLLFNYVPQTSSLTGQVALALFFTVVGIISTGILLRSENSAFANEDPQPVVIDEFAGYFVTLIGHPTEFHYLFVAFFLFRIFDILKPPPVSTAENLPGAYGVMMDDVVAGAIANVVLVICTLVAT